jgi:hypothetical protein
VRRARLASLVVQECTVGGQRTAPSKQNGPKPRQNGHVLKRWHIVVGLLLTLSLLWPLIVAPYFSHHDNVQTMRIYEMHECVIDAQIPCRWVPDLGGGYGNPLFNYYGPLPYYVGELFYLATHDIISAAKLTFATGFVLPFFFSYLLGSTLWGKLGGSLSAIFFIFAPYHAYNMYSRGAMGELWGMAAFPLVFWAFVRVRNKPGAWNSLLLGVGAALLIVSHNLSALLLLAVLAVFAAVQLWSSKQFSYAKHLLLAAVWAVALSAFYLFPMLLENRFVHLENLTLNEYNYAEHFEGLRAVLLDKPWWSPGSSARVSYQVGTVHVLAWALSLCATYVSWRKNNQLRLLAVTFSLMIVLCIFMIHPASSWIWDRVGPLSYLQFPWRLLSVISFATSTLAGASLLLFRSHKSRVIAWSVLVVLVSVTNVGWFQPEKFLDVTQADLLSDGGWDNLRMYAIGDFLPESAEVAPEHPASAVYAQLSGRSDIADVEIGSNWVRFNANSDTGALVQINKFDFPIWQVTIDGQSVAHARDSTSGLINVSLPPGAHTVEARLRDTPLRIASNFISAGALVVCALMCVRAVFLRQRRADVRLKRLLAAS